MTTQTHSPPPPVRKRWVDRIAYLTAGWAALYATLALAWLVTGRGFPFGEGDPRTAGLLQSLPVEVGAPAFAGLLLASAVAALIMAGPGPAARAGRLPLLAFGLLAAAVLLFLVPDFRLLVLAGYLLVLIVGAPFGWPPGTDYSIVFTWPLLHQSLSMATGFLVAGTVLAWQLRRHHAQGGPPAGWTAPAAAARWGRWAVAVAIFVPLLYTLTRLAWAVRIPLLVDQAFIDELHDTGAALAGLWLASFAMLGALLTLGLSQRWGERFPRWMTGLAGRRVPVKLAVIPATLVSVLVISGGLALFADLPHYHGSFWLLVPAMLWPVWGAALAAATLAYYLRATATPGGHAGLSCRTRRNRLRGGAQEPSRKSTRWGSIPK